MEPQPTQLLLIQGACVQANNHAQQRTIRHFATSLKAAACSGPLYHHPGEWGTGLPKKPAPASLLPLAPPAPLLRPLIMMLLLSPVVLSVAWCVGGGGGWVLRPAAAKRALKAAFWER